MFFQFLTLLTIFILLIFITQLNFRHIDVWVYSNTYIRLTKFHVLVKNPVYSLFRENVVQWVIHSALELRRCNALVIAFCMEGGAPVYWISAL